MRDIIAKEVKAIFDIITDCYDDEALYKKLANNIIQEELQKTGKKDTSEVPEEVKDSLKEVSEKNKKMLTSLDKVFHTDFLEKYPKVKEITPTDLKIDSMIEAMIKEKNMDKDPRVRDVIKSWVIMYLFLPQSLKKHGIQTKPALEKITEILKKEPKKEHNIEILLKTQIKDSLKEYTKQTVKRSPKKDPKYDALNRAFYKEFLEDYPELEKITPLDINLGKMLQDTVSKSGLSEEKIDDAKQWIIQYLFLPAALSDEGVTATPVLERLSDLVEKNPDREHKIKSLLKLEMGSAFKKFIRKDKSRLNVLENQLNILEDKLKSKGISKEKKEELEEKRDQAKEDLKKFVEKNPSSETDTDTSEEDAKLDPDQYANLKDTYHALDKVVYENYKDSFIKYVNKNLKKEKLTDGEKEVVKDIIETVYLHKDMDIEDIENDLKDFNNPNKVTKVLNALKALMSGFASQLKEEKEIPTLYNYMSRRDLLHPRYASEEKTKIANIVSYIDILCKKLED